MQATVARMFGWPALHPEQLGEISAQITARVDALRAEIRAAEDRPAASGETYP
jgi:hypothetical protein